MTWNRDNKSGGQMQGLGSRRKWSLPTHACSRSSRLPDARNQAEANPSRVLVIAGELRMEHAILSRDSQDDEGLQHRCLGVGALLKVRHLGFRLVPRALEPFLE